MSISQFNKLDNLSEEIEKKLTRFQSKSHENEQETNNEIKELIGHWAQLLEDLGKNCPEKWKRRAERTQFAILKGVMSYDEEIIEDWLKILKKIINKPEFWICSLKNLLYLTGLREDVNEAILSKINGSTILSPLLIQRGDSIDRFSEPTRLFIQKKNMRYIYTLIDGLLNQIDFVTFHIYLMTIESNGYNYKLKAEWRLLLDLLFKVANSMGEWNLQKVDQICLLKNKSAYLKSLGKELAKFLYCSRLEAVDSFQYLLNRAQKTGFIDMILQGFFNYIREHLKTLNETKNTSNSYLMILPNLLKEPELIVIMQPLILNLLSFNNQHLYNTQDEYYISLKNFNLIEDLDIVQRLIIEGGFDMKKLESRQENEKFINSTYISILCNLQLNLILKFSLLKQIIYIISNLEYNKKCEGYYVIMNKIIQNCNFTYLYYHGNYRAVRNQLTILCKLIQVSPPETLLRIIQLKNYHRFVESYLSANDQLSHQFGLNLIQILHTKLSEAKLPGLENTNKLDFELQNLSDDGKMLKDSFNFVEIKVSDQMEKDKIPYNDKEMKNRSNTTDEFDDIIELDGDETEPPRYLAECLTYLCSDDDRVKFQFGLDHLPNLLRTSDPTTLNQLAELLAKRLVSLSNHYEDNEFEIKREDLIIQLITMRFALVSRALIPNLFTGEFGFLQRRLILRCFIKALIIDDQLSDEDNKGDKDKEADTLGKTTFRSLKLTLASQSKNNFTSLRQQIPKYLYFPLLSAFQINIKPDIITAQPSSYTYITHETLTMEIMLQLISLLLNLCVNRPEFQSMQEQGIVLFEAIKLYPEPKILAPLLDILASSIPKKLTLDWKYFDKVDGWYNFCKDLIEGTYHPSLISKAKIVANRLAELVNQLYKINEF